MDAEKTNVAPRRIVVLADEMLGHTRTGGIGTATTFLALALSRMGHRVDFLYVGDPPTAPMEPEWARSYERAGVAVRLLPRGGDRVEPPFLARPRDAELALAADPPDIVIAQDLAAPASTALRARQLSLAFERTLFVVYCHGGRRWITDTARKVRVLPGAHAVTILEQAAVELADVVVSPSAYLLDWMRRQGWRLPDASLVIPYLTRAVATGEPPPQSAPNVGRVERIAFFGRLEERKGLRQFAAGLNATEPDLLRDVELVFVGRDTPAWPAELVEGLLSETTRRALRAVSFETNLDQPEALARLSRPGTLAVMPSLGETFSNAVYECLERGIPFIASDAGAPAELVAPEDRARVLFEPTPAGVKEALRRALANGNPLQPARPAFDPSVAYQGWAEVVAREPAPRVPAAAESRADSSEWAIWRDGDDVLDDDCVETLVRAQAASGADVVTCGVRLEGGVERFFLGDPGGLGLLANHYGTIALVRRALLRDLAEHEDPWALYARLSLEGAKIVSVPRVLANRAKAPGDVESNPATALQVIREFERHLPRGLRGLARLAAGLAAAPAPAPRQRTFLRRLLRR
jgi:glycosyltransferase involved in cell wall biosynthesis